ncbi:hypothetical protein ABFY60_02475 [Lysinibacillus pakistanensis]|uniref:hypothetical protein n=1 Tax=Lysinibacillus pakistanensis TaxID=759811 RepID=UPI003D28FA52
MNTKMVWIIFAFLGILVVTLFLELSQVDRNFNNSVSDIIKRILVIGVAIAIFSNLNFTIIIRYFNQLIRNLFVIGVGLLILSLSANIMLINENAVSFLIVPYCGYIVCRQSRFIGKIISYSLLVFLLYLTDGRAALLAFLSTPILIFIMKYKILRILFSISITLIFTTLLIIFIDNLGGLNTLLSGRIVIQEAYIKEIVESLSVFTFGSGEFILGEDILYGLGTHQTWLGIIWTSGIIGLFLNVFVFIYVFKNNIKKEYLYVHLIAGYILLIQLFETINIGGISYLSILLLTTLLIWLKKDNKENILKNAIKVEAKIII